MFSHGGYGAVPVTAGRAMRENGGLGEVPPGSTKKNRTKNIDTMSRPNVLRSVENSSGIFGYGITGNKHTDAISQLFKHVWLLSEQFL